MWTKEDLRVKYIKITSQQDYDTVVKVLHELGIQQYAPYKGEKYQSKFNSVFITDDSYYFLTESNYSDIPIQQFYDYLASKTLKVEDLVEGEIYVGKHTIYKWNGKGNNLYRIIFNNFHKDDNSYWDNISPDRMADSEEKKHLEVCIKQNKFIPKEDLHLYDDITFELKSQIIPEYVEYIDTKYKGQIVRVEDWLNSSYCKVIFADGTKEQPFKHLVKPSTKEAFEAQNKPKFIEGKWYKGESNNIYIKFSSIEKCNGYDRIHYTERIYDSKHKVISDYWASDYLEKFALNNPVDISEIQQYLPDGHPDKIKPMEKSLVGRYVKTIYNWTKWGIKKDEYLKILEDRDNCFIYEKYGVADKPISKYFELMPEGFEPPKESEWIPQVGDWIVVTKNDNSYNTNQKEFIGQICEYYSLSSYWINNHNVKGDYEKYEKICCDNYPFRKAEPHEIPNNTTQEVITEMSKEELLEEAKRRYPVGTNFKSPYSGNEIKIVGINFKFNTNEKDIYEVNTNGFVYYEGKWAEIVSLPKDYVTGIDPIKEYPLTPSEAFKIDNNQVNLLVKQSGSVTLRKTENEVNIKVNNLKTIKI